MAPIKFRCESDSNPKCAKLEQPKKQRGQRRSTDAGRQTLLSDRHSQNAFSLTSLSFAPGSNATTSSESHDGRAGLAKPKQ
jgi:hypothetical protein